MQQQQQQASQKKKAPSSPLSLSHMTLSPLPCFPTPQPTNRSRRSRQILYGHVDNVSHAQLETARRAAVLRADVDAALDALLGPGAAAELRAASAGAAAAARRARLSAADSATRFARFTGAYAGVLCSAVLFGEVASSAAGVVGREEVAATKRCAPLMLPAPRAATAKNTAVPFASSSSISAPSSATASAAPIVSSAQERWAAAAAEAAFGQGALAASSSSSTSTSFLVGERRQGTRRDAAEGEEEEGASSSSAASSGTTAAAFAFLGVLPFGLLPFLRRGGQGRQSS